MDGDGAARSASEWIAPLTGLRPLFGRTFEAAFARPAGFSFEPGQHVRFRSRRMEREYSMVSIPEDPELRFCIRDTGTGNFSSALASAAPGTDFSFTGPHGYFRFRPSARIPLFVATGTGIAPFVSMARAGVSGFVLLHGVRSVAELHYADVFRSAADIYVPCLSDSAFPDQTENAFSGRVTDYLERRLPEGRYDAYLCGRREMIRDATLLLDDRFPDSRVFSETFF